MSEDFGDSYTEVSETSWLSRIGKSIIGILFGLVLFFAAFPLLFWNEGRSVKRYKTLKDGSGLVVSIPADAVDMANNGKLIHVSGLAETGDTLIDPELQVSTVALKLRRTVKMYQWDEESKTKTEKKLGGGERKVTTYSYRKIWSENLIDSSRFKKPRGHENPGSMPITSKSFVAKNVTLGGFTLSKSLLNGINTYQPISGIDIRGFSGVGGRDCVTDGGKYYCGKDPARPKIGDFQIGYSEVPSTPVSIVAQQQGKSFTSYQTKAGGTIELLRIGNHDAKAMFNQAQTANKWLSWILRAAGLFMMFMGISMVLKPLSVVADVLPILGNIVGTGTSILSLLLAGVFSSITISIAWIFYRPLIGAILLVVAGGLFCCTYVLTRKKKVEGVTQPKRSSHMGQSGARPAAPARPSSPPPIPESVAAGGAAPPVPPPASQSVSTEALIKQGLAAFKAGNHKEAIRALNEAIKLNHENATAYFNRGVIFYKIKQTGQAIEDLKAAARLGHKKAQGVLESKGLEW
jgi:tetratricopeptide (TPR) repeat protein